MTVRAAWLLPVGQTRDDTRLAPVGTMAPQDELTSRAGVVAGGSPFAAAGAGAMSLQIGIGRAVVQGTTAQGAYPVTVTAPEVVTFADGNAQFDRIDSVILHVYDALFDTDGQTLAAVEIRQGEANETPTAPTLPAACLRLWDVTVPAGASAGVGGIDWSSALADRRAFTSSYGGIIPRGWGLSFAGAYDGQYRDNGGVLERWNAAAGQWQTYRPPAVPVEEITSGLTAGSGWGINGFRARRDSRTVSATGYLTRTGAALPADPNLVDTVIATLPNGWRPLDEVEAPVSDGYGSGMARVEPDGEVTLRTWSPGTNIGNGANLRFTATFIQ